MVNVKSKILKIRNLPKDGKRIDHVNAKPYLFIIVCLIVGVALLFTKIYFVGIVITLLFLYYFVFVRDVVLVEFYDQYAVFYLNNGKDECFLLFWEDVVKWEIINNRNDLDHLNIIMRNQESITLKCLSKKKVAKYFGQYTGNTDCEVTKQRVL